MNGLTANTISKSTYQQPPEQSSKYNGSFEHNSPITITETEMDKNLVPERSPSWVLQISTNLEYKRIKNTNSTDFKDVFPNTFVTKQPFRVKVTIPYRVWESEQPQKKARFIATTQSHNTRSNTKTKTNNPKRK